MRWIFGLAMLCGCSGGATEVVTFPDARAGDALVDGKWVGSRKYAGPRKIHVRPAGPEADWPCATLEWSVEGRSSPVDGDYVIDGKLVLSGDTCDSPIRKPYTLTIERPN